MGLGGLFHRDKDVQNHRIRLQSPQTAVQESSVGNLYFTKEANRESILQVRAKPEG